MQVPKCANWLQGTCERSDTVVAETRNGQAYVILCRTCKSINVWSRSKVKGQAREQARLKRLHEMNERERKVARQAVKFLPPKRGWA